MKKGAALPRIIFHRNQVKKACECEEDGEAQSVHKPIGEKDRSTRLPFPSLGAALKHPLELEERARKTSSD
jgi:hypothetical protein